MAKVTSKLQVTVPKGIADQFGIRPGDEIEFVPDHNHSLRVLLGGKTLKLGVEERLKRFDEATRRQREREKQRAQPIEPALLEDRGWRREDLYDRGLPD